MYNYMINSAPLETSSISWIELHQYKRIGHEIFERLYNIMNTKRNFLSDCEGTPVYDKAKEDCINAENDFYEFIHADMLIQNYIDKFNLMNDKYKF